MTYRELLELYSQGKLDEQQKQEIERELEKQEAISDYLFEHQAPPGMEDLFDGTSPFGVSKGDEESEKPDADVKDDSEAITKQINRSIRKAFIKTGAIATIIAFILTLFVVFALPHIVSAFYYDPGKSIGMDENGTEIEQFERDMSVYAELSIPELGPEIIAGTEKYGYGNYSYYLSSRFQVGGDDRIVEQEMPGTIKKNTITCYNSDVLKFCHSNYFCEEEIYKNTVKTMNETDLYYTYVTFKDYVPYEEFYAEYVGDDDLGTNESWVWCGIKTDDEDITGDQAKFGFYAVSDKNKQEQLETEEKAKEHFSSMINYLLDNEKFLSTDGQIDPKVPDTKVVESEGVKVFGFAYVTDKEHVENIMKADNVYQVAVNRIVD